MDDAINVRYGLSDSRSVTNISEKHLFAFVNKNSPVGMVKDHNVVAYFTEPVTDPAPDETVTTGHENLHEVTRTRSVAHCSARYWL